MLYGIDDVNDSNDSNDFPGTELDLFVPFAKSKELEELEEMASTYVRLRLLLARKLAVQRFNARWG